MTERERLVAAVGKARWRAYRSGSKADIEQAYESCKCDLCRALNALAAYDRHGGKDG